MTMLRETSLSHKTQPSGVYARKQSATDSREVCLIINKFIGNSTESGPHTVQYIMHITYNAIKFDGIHQSYQVEHVKFLES